MKNLFWNLKNAIDWEAVVIGGIGGLAMLLGIGAIAYYFF